MGDENLSWAVHCRAALYGTTQNNGCGPTPTVNWVVSHWRSPRGRSLEVQMGGRGRALYEFDYFQVAIASGETRVILFLRAAGPYGIINWSEVCNRGSRCIPAPSFWMPYIKVERRSRFGESNGCPDYGDRYIRQRLALHAGGMAKGMNASPRNSTMHY